VLRNAIVFLAVFCLADWVLVQDIGLFGGLGTDPNSMIPLLLLVIAGYLALVPARAVQPTKTLAPAPTEAPAQTVVPAQTAGAVPVGTAAGEGWRNRLRPAALRRAIGAASGRSVVSAGAVGVILLGAVPMAAAQASRTADPIVAESIAGPSGP
jgi:hypothetical protein